MKNFTKQITNKTLFKPTRWLLVALMLLLGTSSAWGRTIYLDPGVWNTAGAWFAAWIYGGGVTDAWYTASLSDDGTTYKFDNVPDAATTMILTRQQSGTTYKEPNWDPWNKIENISLTDQSKNLYKVTDWGAGSWSVYTPPTTYTGTIKFKRPSAWNNVPHIHIFYDRNNTLVSDNEMTSVCVDASGNTWYKYDYSITTTFTTATIMFNNGGWSNGQTNEQFIGDLGTNYCLTGGSSADVTEIDCLADIQLIGDESQLNLGDVEVGQSKTVQIEFEYCGITGINPQLLDIQTGFSGSGSQDSNNRTITYNITFTPTEAGEKTATIYIPYANGGLYQQQITANGIVVCTRPVIVTNSATYNQGTGLVDINYSISETGDATTHYGIQYRAEGSPFPTEGLTDADFIKIGQTDNTVTNATYTYQTVLTPGTYYFRTYANNGCPAFDYSVGMVYGQEKQVVVPKKAQSPLTLTGVETTYCTVPNGPITLSTTGGDGDGAVSYQIVNDGTTATASITTNQLSITSAGTLKLKAIKAEDTNFNPAESAEVTVTIYADIEAGSIIASTTRVCQGDDVTLTLSGHTADVDNITWYADDELVATGSNTEYTASNLQETTSYKVKVTRQDVSCPEKTKVTEEPIQISVDRTSAITLSGNEATECIGTSINLKEKVESNTGTVTWYSNADCRQQVVDASNVTINSTATYYAKAKNGECPATDAVAYTITAKGATISRTPAGDIHPYEVTIFTANKEATWKLTANPAEGDELSADDPTFSGKTTAYITKAADTTTTFKGEAATGYTISATAEECTTTQTFNVVDDPNSCQQ